MSERLIQPYTKEQIADLKSQIERRWDSKPWYGGTDDMRSPGCMMRAHEILGLIAAYEQARKEALETACDIVRKQYAHVPGHDPDVQGKDLVSYGYGNACFNILGALHRALCQANTETDRQEEG